MHMDLKTIQKAKAPFVGGISGFLGVLLVAGFSVGGTEVVAVTAGESDDPKSLCLKQLNKCFGVYFYSMYYQLQSLVQLFRTDPSLLRASSSISQESIYNCIR